MARPRTGKGERVVIDSLYVEELRAIADSEMFPSIGAVVNNALREWLKCRSGEPCSTVSKLQDVAPIQAKQGVSLDVDFQMETI
ncbi:hypothetical protein [Leptolyngbya sp. NIES-2104]|uniref:hypothetical protein n=1 Tax=Leptolyngbya sp. NIES-2104 TaxID=1552121 RepID=UPI0006EC498E|nr:hypothetical protein [Leptolyngbya sp. NIES-2104]GAP96098.1 hypothetical protein NIES2104_26330 [Leptolyngbya sp. NIES-2104]